MIQQKKRVQTFGKKKTALAVANIKQGRGLIRINGSPIDLIRPELLRMKIWEPILILGLKKFEKINIKIKVKGGGYTGQVYAIRQAIAKGIIAYYQKYEQQSQKREMKQLILQYDRSLLVADPRRCQPKKFGGPGARARQQKSYR